MLEILSKQHIIAKEGMFLALFGLVYRLWHLVVRSAPGNIAHYYKISYFNHPD